MRVFAACRRFLARAAHLFRDAGADREAQREITAHLAVVEDDYRRQGLSDAEARRRARLAIGGPAQTEEAHRDARGFMLLDDLQRDVRYALRTLARTPTFTVVAVLTLALGIGVNTAIFSVVHAVLLAPLPFQRSDRLVRIYRSFQPAEGSGGAPSRINAIDTSEFLALEARPTPFSSLATVGFSAVTVSADGRPLHLTGAPASASVFPMLGVQPVLGRWFSNEEETPGRDNVIVLGHAAWQTYFGGDPAILGRSIVFTGRAAGPLGGTTPLTAYTIIGVMPETFRFPDDGTEFWIPRAVLPSSNNRPRLVGGVIARLRDGISLDAATRELNNVLHDVSRPPGVPNAHFELAQIEDEIGAPVRPALLALMAAVGCVLLIACSNVTSLVLARTGSRSHEFAMRMALGAGRGRLLRQLLTETLILSSGAAVSGVVLSLAGISTFRRIAANLPRRDLGGGAPFPKLDTIAVSGPTLAFALGVSLVAGVVVWLAPAFRGEWRKSTDVLRGHRASTSSDNAHNFSTRGVLLITQIVGATILLVSSALLIRSFLKLTAVPLGYEPAHVLTFQVNLPGDRRQAASLVAFADAVVERLRVEPGVQFSAYANQLPTVNLRDTAGGLWSTPDPARPPSPRGADARIVSREYVNTMGIRVVDGRGFDERDTSGAPHVLLVNESLARHEFGSARAVGRTVYIGRLPTPWTIVGVVADVHQFGLDRDPEPQFFVDFRQAPGAQVVSFGSDAVGFGSGVPILPAGAYYVVRANIEPAALAAIVRDAVRAIDGSATVDNMATMDAIVSNALTRPRLYAMLFGIFAAIAIVLAAIGVYGMLAYSVTQRTHEIGIRMALGAERRAVLGMVLKQSTTLTLIGTAIGLAGAAATTRFLQSLLFGLTPLDATTFVGAAVIFIAVAALAAYVPARRATRVDPLVALRAE